MDITHNLKKITTGALVSGAVARGGEARLGLAAGAAHAGAYHWCPGDPPPQAVVPRPAWRLCAWLGPVNPNWDTTVCHDYVARDSHSCGGGALLLAAPVSAVVHVSTYNNPQPAHAHHPE